MNLPSTGPTRIPSARTQTADRPGSQRARQVADQSASDRGALQRLLDLDTGDHRELGRRARLGHCGRRYFGSGRCQLAVTSIVGEQSARCTASAIATRSEEHTSELQSPCNLVCRLLLEKKKKYHER